MHSRELMEIALKAGEILLTGGAEIYRVEDTLNRICESYGEKCESFVLPTGIFISLKSRNGSDVLTAFKRIRDRSVDLYRVEQVNNFSRNLRKELPDFEKAMAELESIEKHGLYPFPLRLAVAGVASLVFTVLFRGGIWEGVAAIPVGMLIYSIKEILSGKGFFQFFELFLAGLAAGAASMLAVKLFPGFNLYKIIIGAVMLFLPGVAITSSIKDALYGDLVSSLSRMGEAVFVAAAVGVGVAIALSVGLNWG